MVCCLLARLARVAGWKARRALGETAQIAGVEGMAQDTGLAETLGWVKGSGRGYLLSPREPSTSPRLLRLLTLESDSP